MVIKINNINEIEAAARKFLSETEGKRIFAFYGNMGVGKTTFISALCRELGVDNETGSPTFSIINEYKIQSEPDKIFHFDCYRLENKEDILEIGTEEYLYSGCYCFIEWPEIMEFLLPDETLKVYLAEDISTGVRTIKF